MEISKNAIVLGRGLIRCSMAEFLADKGKKVMVAEVLSEIANDTPYNSLTGILLASLKSKGIEIPVRVRL